MLKIYVSPNRVLNQNHLLRNVCDHAGEGEALQMVLVPEQISHMLERKLCEVGGDSISRYAEILGFSRLAVRVFSEYGGIAETETDSAGQLLTMSLTVEQLRSRLKLYGSKSLKPNFLLQLATTLDELRCSCISPDLLRSRIGELEGAFAVKMEELALLMEGYDSVCANLGQNPDSRLTRLLLALEQNDFARDKRFCFYGFTDFNGIEMEIISQILADGGEACVYLLCDQLNSDEQQFSTAAETGRDLMKLARKTHTPYEIFTLSSNKSSEDLSFLRGNLFGVRQVESEEADRICFLSAADIATECRIAAGEILRLLENGVRLRDITVACADYDSYRAPLKTVLHRAEIPAYFAGDTNILKQPVVHMLLSALAAVTDFDRDEILNYMKSGFTGLGDSEADKLENYILLWNIEGKRFEEHWTMSTLGLQDEKESLKQLRLAELNKSRVALMKPLLHLRHGLFGAKNTGEMLLALNRFMDEISLNEKLNSLAIELSKQQKKQKAQEYAQVYGIICRLMEQMYGVLGETIRTVDDFTLLFRTAVSLYTVGTIPATIDCVNVGSLSSQRNSDTPYLFVLGANEGAFPTVGSNQTLLSDRERQQLIRLDIGISPNTVATGRLNRELAIIDSVLGGPVRKLYISAIRGRESHLYLRSRNLFPYGECIETEEALLCRSSRDHDAKYGKTERYTISDLSKDAVEALYGKELRLSASKLEKAASCAFSYFLQYGLKAKESQSAEVDASIYGTFVHYVLEHTCRQVQEEKGFHVVTLDRVMEIADALMERFAEEELSELWHSERAEYLFRRNFHEVRYVVKQLYEELSVSEFEPAFFEMLFADTEDAPVRAIPISGPSVKGTLEGKVDRMDLWKQGNRTYYRVIDYKTGHTAFNYTNVYYGLGMQMLIYLFAIKEYGDRLPHDNLTPAGVLYFPARSDKISIKDRYDEEGLQKGREKNEVRSGLLLEDPAVLHAMEPGTEFRFLPCEIKKGEIIGDLASVEDLRLLEEHVLQHVQRLAESIYTGTIEANPYFVDNKHNGCIWCPYKAICGDQIEKKRVLESMNSKEFWQRLKQEVSHG